ncbi:MAG: minor capsid protein [Clostridiales bacterium]|nr:minor capsid protein [Clostridiales bacterium]
MLIQGRNPKTLVKEFSKTFDTKEYEAYRLLHTEGSFIMGQGTLAGYQEDGVKKYRILATLDVKTSDKCRGMDGKEFNVEDAVVGVNYWPFHPHCRTTDVPVYEDDDLSEETRTARDPVTGKTHDVKADMTYEQWHSKHIENNPKALLEEKKWKNRHGD